MYKVGPILSISHGMGMPSASILLHEVSLSYICKEGNLAKTFLGDQADVPCWSPEPNLLQVDFNILHTIVLEYIKLEVNRSFDVFHRKTKCNFIGLEHVDQDT